MKAKILSELRNRNETVSGEFLSSTLGISRVSIWKHIHKLQELGYNIISTASGYRLAYAPDIPYPWEFPEREDRIHFFPEVSSTMDTARDLARNNCSEFSVVIAGRQTAGRGRLNRQWRSEDGGLYFTVVLRPDIAVPISSRVNFLASLTMAQVLREGFHIEAAVKWPNDILIGDRKLAGILIDVTADRAGDGCLVITGVGVNVAETNELALPLATTLSREVGRPVQQFSVRRSALIVRRAVAF